MTTEPERRLTPTERLHEVTMAYAQRAASPPEHSIEISRNAKGVEQLGLTMRGADIAEIIDLAMHYYDLLKRTYPYPENGA